jgi:hypothetical protein
MQHLSLDPVVVPNTFNSWVKWLSALKVQSDHVTLLRLLLQSHDRVLYVESTVGSKGFWDDQQGLGESCYTEFLSTLGLGLGFLIQVLSTGDFESSGTGDQRFVFDGVLYGSETIPDRVRDLCNGMGVGSWRQMSRINVSDEHGIILPSNSPLTNNVTLLGSLTFSTKVYFSSPKVCSYTNPAYPSTSGLRSSTEF